MEKQLLHSGWKMRAVGGEFIPAKVPGSVYNDLLENGRMEDPYWRDNELEALKIMDNDFEYTAAFDADKNILGCDGVILRFDGLDTICDISLNGEALGSADNMHRSFEFDVKDIVKEKGNVLTILFHSPTKYIKEKYAECRADGSSDAMVGFPHIRKPHCMFGWDWGPRLPDAGIWKPVYLLGINTARIDGVYVRQKHTAGRVELNLEVEVDYVSGAEVSYEAVLTSPDGKRYEIEGETDSITVEDPKLWWPNGYGGQPLYTLAVSLVEAGTGTVLDTWERRIGLRTMTVSREKDSYGESFAHEVNGVKIFAMGADYIPEDNIFSRINPERTRELLEQCVAANFNCVRVWGGGHYPMDDFFDSCDELGLVVWEDLMFACAVYELTPEFHENIKQEITENVKRIRHHASLGLWCGNNEMEMFVDRNMWVNTPKQKADYIRMYEYLIPCIMKEHDPETFYWCASPSSGGGFDEPNDPTRGDVHYWDVWHGFKPFTDYRKHQFRYLSEFGFESLPLMKTTESFTLPEDRNLFSYVMEKHQRCSRGNMLTVGYMQQMYKYPSTFDLVTYTSQLLQAEGIKYGVEHFRRIRGVCMGAIYWQLNDCWPVASWASIDYFGRWKALHYFAKRFFAPVMISCEEEGILTQDTNVNAEPYEVQKSIRLSVANETLEDKSFTVIWSLRSADGKIKEEHREEADVPRLSSKWLEKEDLARADLYNDYVSFSLLEEGTEVSSGSVFFCQPKHFNFVDPELAARLEGDEIVVTAKAYAKSVEILNENEDLILSDNYFDMNPGEKRLKIVRGDASVLRIRSVFDIK